jgi:hypothetical protein
MRGFGFVEMASEALRSEAQGIKSRNILRFVATTDGRPQGGWLASKETSQASGSLTLCRAGIDMNGSPFREMLKPKRGGLVEARSQGQRGKYLGEG